MVSNNVVVIGDVTLDWYFLERLDDKQNNDNEEILNSENGISKNKTSRLDYGISMYPQFGGALFLSKMIKNSFSENLKNYEIIDQGYGYQKPEDEVMYINRFVHNPENILHRYIKLDLFPLSQKLDQNKEKVYRVSEYFGYAATSGNSPIPISIDKKFDKPADFIIIEDLGLIFRNCEQSWLNLLGERKPIVIYDMFTPLFMGELWEKINAEYMDNLILILDADDLRDLGANISKSLSWEKTALELLWEINHNEELRIVRSLKNVIIRFGVEGAIHYTGEKNKLYFDPSYAEGGFWDISKFGSMRGTPLVFTSSLASEIISTKEVSDKTIKAGTVNGLKKCRKFLQEGYRSELQEEQNNLYKYCGGKLSEQENKESRIICQQLPTFKPESKDPDPDFWSILKEKASIESEKNKLLPVAENIVLNGWSAISDFPTGHFGKLTTVDRAEIESFGSLKRIMDGYINGKMKDINLEKNPKPLSIAVFGAPGSGKSFGIIEVAKSIDPNKVYSINFNVSQFTSTTDLINALYRVRDISITGKIPLVFFDEFDCSFNAEPFGWLKYFLAPMQDGEFMDCGIIHPIGKSIFVFAGGRCENFKEFCEYAFSNKTFVQKLLEKSPEKGNDFVSRLRGYVDILGPNMIKKDMKGWKDEAYIIRRAVLLRSLIEKNAPNIIDKKTDKAEINNNLLKTLLKIQQYKHGVRSMEAIIDMSLLQGQKSWNKSSLPPKDQLALHVDEKEFISILGNSQKPH
jgi:hypothetical protein